MSQVKKSIVLVTDAQGLNPVPYSTLAVFLNSPEGKGYSRDTINNALVRRKQPYTDGKINLTRLDIVYKTKKV